jgi:hypothetical protein
VPHDREDQRLRFHGLREAVNRNSAKPEVREGPL